MMKQLIILILTSVLCYVVHFFILTDVLTIIDTTTILKQHLFLGGAVLVLYLSMYITSRISPLHTGFVFLGLILAKLIIAGFFINQMGWLEDGAPIQPKAIFLGFYMIYVITLVVVSVKLIQGIDNSK